MVMLIIYIMDKLTFSTRLKNRDYYKLLGKLG